MTRTPSNTAKRRNKRWKPVPALQPIDLTQALELPDDDSTREDTYPDKQIVNSGPHGYESTLTRELKISVGDTPIAPGSWITDYDAIAHTVNKLTVAAVNAKNRLEWAGDTIRALEIALWEKEAHIAKLQGTEPPPSLPKVPFFDVETNPDIVVISKSVVNRAGMILVGSIAGGIGLAMVAYLIFT